MMEKEWLKFFRDNLPLNDFKVYDGQKGNMELPAPNCDGKNEKYQFGDFRIETPTTTIAVEVENDSSRGIDNFLKYWPYLAGQTSKKPAAKEFVLVHDYGKSVPTYKALWWFLRGRMPSLVVKAHFILFENGDKQKNDILESIRKFLTE